jgi:hypothetical protein
MSTMPNTKRKRSRRSFTEEFKAGAVRLVLDEGKTVAAVARRRHPLCRLLGQRSANGHDRS